MHTRSTSEDDTEMGMEQDHTWSPLETMESSLQKNVRDNLALQRREERIIPEGFSTLLLPA